jgi:hypothetical protein
MEVADGERTSVLERLRTGPTNPTGKAMAAALARVGEITDLGLGMLDLSAVPHGKVVALARYGMTAKVTVLRRHPVARQLATLLATVVHLEGEGSIYSPTHLDLHRRPSGSTQGYSRRSVPEFAPAAQQGMRTVRRRAPSFLLWRTPELLGLRFSRHGNYGGRGEQRASGGGNWGPSP